MSGSLATTLYEKESDYHRLNQEAARDEARACSEENVEIFPLNNPVIMERLEIGLHMPKEHLVKDQLEEIQEQSAFLSETGRFNLPLKSVFIPKSPKVEMTDYQPPYDRRDPRRPERLEPELWPNKCSHSTAMIKFRFSMVVGPPGTGKTQTIVAMTTFIPKHGLKDRFLRLRSWNDAHTRLFSGNEPPCDDVGKIAESSPLRYVFSIHSGSG
jgi:hypothetical protein